MSWMSQLYQTYENLFDWSEGGIPPKSHRVDSAQIEILLNADGDFQNARILEGEGDDTLYPVTDESQGRTSTVMPHPLCDHLSYLAGDFSEHCAEPKKAEPKKAEPEKAEPKKAERADEQFSAYLKGLKDWEDSKFSHPKVRAILLYVQKREMVADLVKSGIIELDEDGKFKKKRINGVVYDKVFVRFSVITAKDGKYEGTWKDTSLMKSYIDYYFSKGNGREDICCFTGQKKMISKYPPRQIVEGKHANAKLISVNDREGYTYRGRFQNAEQAYALSYDASEKIHNALRWLIKEQGVYVGEEEVRTFVCWSPAGKKVPDIIDEDEFGLSRDDAKENFGLPYRQKLKKMLQGHREQFEVGDQVIVMSLDAATKGRLSITYYNEFDALGFLDRVEYWGQSCKWWFLKRTPEGKAYHEEETPSFRRIAKCAFGREKVEIEDGKEKKFIYLKDKILKEQFQRLLKCMLERQPIPSDIVQALTNRASTPMAYSKKNREIVLSTACSVIAKHLYRKGEEEQMKLDLEKRDRSYLFGRLLAVLERVERVTYYKDDEKDKEREPNAIRSQSAYVNHPMQTWKSIEYSLPLYFQKLTPGSREYYKTMIAEIIGLLPEEEDEQSLNQRLKETYLLGYYLQREELKKKEESKNGEPAEQN